MQTAFNLRKLNSYFDTSVDLKDYITQVSGARFSKQGRTWKCKSPLNTKDKNPSFTITDGKQVFYCFSSGIGGNIITFAETYYRLDRDSAILRIAEDLGVDLSEYLADETQTFDKQTGVLDLALNYCINLAKTNGEFKAFFDGRGISDVGFLTTENVGYCDSAGRLGDYLKASGCDMSIVESLGLLKEDRMTNSLVFPVYDRYGRLVRFVCRPLSGGGGSKYINTIEYSEHNTGVIMGTERIPVYHPGARVFIVEGAIDYLAVKYRWGAPSTVALAMCGLKMPMLLVNQLVDLGYHEVFLWVDGDVAGRNFVSKVYDELFQRLESFGIMANIIYYDGRDPDAVVRTKSIDEVVQEAMYLPIFISEQKMFTLTDEASISNYLFKVGAGLSGPGLMMYVKWVAGALGLQAELVHSMMANYKSPKVVDVEFEKYLLSHLLQRPAVINTFDLDKHVFSILVYQRIFDAIHEEGLDASAIQHRFGHDKLVRGLFDPSENNYNLMEVVKALKSFRDYRLILNTIETARKEIPTVPSMDVIGYIEDSLLRVKNVTESTADRGDNLLVSVVDSIMSREEGNKDYIPFNQENWPRTNATIFGVVPGKLVIIQAPTGHGKTTLALNWVNDATIEYGAPCLFISGEMDGMEIMRRVISINTGIPNTSISYNGMTSENAQRLMELVRSGKHFDKLHIDTTVEFSKVVNLIKHSVRRHSIKYAVIDYIQLLDLTGQRFKDLSSYEKYKEATRVLKVLAQELGICIIILGQQGDEALDDKTPQARRLAGAKAMNNDADVSIAFRKKTQKEIEEDGANRGNLVINIDKVRYNRSQVVFYAFEHYESLRIREVS